MTTQAARATDGLRITGLVKRFGDRTVVDDLDLTVHPGELVSLLGPSGCGKTTTLRMVAGFLAADGGSIEIEGKDVVGLPPERRPSAMVFQNYALWPHMTVFKNVAYPLRLRRLPKHEVTERVEHVLGLVNLLHHRDSRPATISGGEQQRAALARALVQEPQLLLLDEPLSNLDAKLRVKVREDIRELQQRLGITTVLVTHDQDEALSMSDRIAVMNGGRIEQVSAPDELYTDPRTEFVAGFVGQLNSLPGRLVGGRLVPEEGLLTGVRPEDVRLIPVDEPGASAAGHAPQDRLRGRVVRVVPRGAFHELVVEVEDRTLHSLAVGQSLPVGQEVYVDLARPLLFRDGRRLQER